MTYTEQLKENLKLVLKETIISEFNVDEVDDIKIETPKDPTHGDYATNIAMILTKQLKDNPRNIASKIVESIDQHKANIEQISVAGPGFINFTMDKSFLQDVLKTVISEGTQYGKRPQDKDRVLLEFVSANPTGTLHIGHARNAAVGDSLARIMNYGGYDVDKEYYINDAGNQINNLATSINVRYFEALGESKEMPEDGYRGKEITELGRRLANEHPEYKEMDESERLLMFKDIGVKYLMNELKEDLETFRVEYDSWFYETSLYEDNVINPTVEKLKENGYTYEEDGALWLKTTEFGDDKDRVLIKSDGSYTYFTPDISYHNNKMSRGYDKLIDLLGADHHGYQARLKASMETSGYDKEALEIIIMQVVRLIKDGEEVKMSKRTGKTYTLRDLVQEVGVDAARYFLVMRSSDSHFDFDLDLALSKSNDNPVYYAQYAHARICSILKQSEGVKEGVDLSLITHDKAIDLMMAVANFGEVIELAADRREPHRMTNYVQELASKFHKFYNAEKVLSDDKALTDAYIYMIEAVRQTLSNALMLVGIEAPEEM
ncbi:arginine--tRNA ligase [Abyssicoccus albus]|uniref:arginine--tRNA ligase n=1 Tax=Abyssicoccus albus TaxID=1817405 RepID=UPI00097E3D2F|nr:arginine--tRNA ligase [Abyssicoccus albus]AQL55653.1 arginine--tRNA ligase [Abyssicoccus albus]